MPEFVVAAESRTEKGKNANRRLRTNGRIPGIVYSGGKEAVAVAVSPKEIGSILRSVSGENTLFDLEFDGARRKVILKDFQREPIGGRLIHADFFEVALDKPLEVKVHVELVGVPVGVKTQGGMLDFVTRELEIISLPLDIPAKIVIDVSTFEIGRYVRVSELPASDKYKILTDADVVIAHVTAPRGEEATATEAAPAEGGTEPEVIKKGKEPGEAAAEGEKKGDKKPEKKSDKKDKK
jgi:large subunit ribosomal protein L25